MGPHTGDEADADPTHRHAVRLTRATPSYDPLTRQLLYEVEWCEEDALPFPLCLSSVSDAPACRPLVDVSIARGNVLLVDHGLDADKEIGKVPLDDTVARCEDACHDAEIIHRPGRYRPALPSPDPTFAAPLAVCDQRPSLSCCGGCGGSSAVATAQQDVLAALPEVSLHSALPGDVKKPRRACGWRGQDLLQQRSRRPALRRRGRRRPSRLAALRRWRVRPRARGRRGLPCVLPRRKWRGGQCQPLYADTDRLPRQFPERLRPASAQPDGRDGRRRAGKRGRCQAARAAGAPAPARTRRDGRRLCRDRHA